MKKRINIVLLVLVLGLWGAVIYKYVNNFFFKNQQEVTASVVANPDQTKIKDKDTFELKNLTRDPFLNKTIARNNNYESTKTKYKKIIKIDNSDRKSQLIQEPFPNIDYLGYIKSVSKQNELVLLKVNGKLMKFRINETQDKLRVIKIFKDSVKVSFGKVVKTIKSFN